MPETRENFPRVTSMTGGRLAGGKLKESHG